MSVALSLLLFFLFFFFFAFVGVPGSAAQMKSAKKV